MPRSSNEFSVGIVGAGLMGRWHARYASRAGARIAAIVDPDLVAGRRLAGRFRDANVFPTVVECLRRTELSALHVCSPTAAHRESIEPALEAGQHVLAEKPLAASAAEARGLLERARRAGVTLSAVHQFPFQDGARRLERDRERLGALLRFDFTLCSAGGEGLPMEQRRRALVDMLPHPISLARRFLSRPIEPSAWRIDAFDADGLALSARCERTNAGVFLSLAGRPTRCALTLTGDRATGHLDCFHGFSLVESRPVSRAAKALAPFRAGAAFLAGAAANAARRSLAREPAYPGLSRLIRAFYGAAAGDAQAPVTAEEILEAAVVRDRLLAEGS